MFASRAPVQPPAADQATPDHLGSGSRPPLLGWIGRALAELFPQPPGPSRTSKHSASPAIGSKRGAARAAAVALAVLLGAGILLERQAGDPPWHTLWAEDARVFLPGALAHPMSSLVTPYAGYLQLVPRLIADGVAHLLPLSQVAAGFALAGALTAALCATMVWYASAGHVRGPMFRFLLAASVLLLPLAPLEIASNGVNAPWYLLFAAFWALIWRPRSAAGMTVAALACFAAASSTALVIAFAPLVAARLIALPRVREHAATLGWAAGIAVQVPAMLAPAQMRNAGPATDAMSYYGHEVVLAAVAGEHLALRLQAAVGDHTAVLIAACILAGFATWALVTGDARIRLFTAAALALGALLVAVDAVVRGWPAHTDWAVVSAWQVGSRYAAVPILLIDSAAIIAVDGYRHVHQQAAGTPRWGARRWGARRTAAVVLIAVLGFSWVADFRTVTLRSSNRPAPLSMAVLTSSRATPATLVTRLAGMDRAGTPSQRDRFAFAGLGQLCRDYVLPPPLATEVYRALTDVPGVMIRRNHADIIGRHGIEFRDRVALGNGEGHALETIILSRSGHRLLAIQYQYGGFGLHHHGPIQVVILR